LATLPNPIIEPDNLNSTEMDSKIKRGELIKIKPIDTREEIAKIAGVSHGTVAKVKKIKAKATHDDDRNLYT
jgi:hypothetical protein